MRQPRIQATHVAMVQSVDYLNSNAPFGLLDFSFSSCQRVIEILQQRNQS